MPSLDDLVGQCPPLPEPTPIHRDGYDLALMVPEPTLTTLEQQWAPGDVIQLEVRPGTVNAAGGGACGRWRASTMRDGHRGAWTEWQGSSVDCLPVPEPTELLIPLGVLAALVLARCRLAR